MDLRIRGSRFKFQLHWIESPRIKPYAYGQLIFDKGGKNIQWTKDSLFRKWYWENWRATCKSMKLEHSLTPYTKINSKWLKDWNIRRDSIKLLAENMGKIFSDIHCISTFIGQPPQAIDIKMKINKWDLIKHKLSHSKGSHKQNEKITYRLGENICKWCDQQRPNFHNIQTAHTTKKQPNWKIGKRPKGIFLQRKNTDGQ